MTRGEARALAVSALALCLSLGGCASDIVLGSSDNAVSLRPGDLEAGGLALVTPSTITGQEQEKQALALIFSEVLALQRPKVKLATLAETLGAVNRDGLSDGYKRMYDDYRDTGLLSRDALKLVGTATGMHYVAQLKLQKFSQYSKTRFAPLGIRIFETQIGEIRLFFQVWDVDSGAIAWEAMQERSLSRETVSDRPIQQRALFRAVAEDLVARLP
ncbi:MAG TPA: hypothetical protein VF943_04715 [Burkholderiales bacterium]